MRKNAIKKIKNEFNRMFLSKNKDSLLVKNNTNYSSLIDKSKANKQIMCSVIISVYNKEPFIKKCLESLQMQDYNLDNIELIIIDDQSNDNSINIINSYQDIFENMKLLQTTKNTGGPAIPRNIGIEVATGRYIMFVDADDFLASNALRDLIAVLEKGKDDYAIGRTIRLDKNKSRLVGDYNSNINRINANIKEIPYIFFHLAPTARMIRKELIDKNHIRFPDLKYSEDKKFFLDVLLNAKTIATIDKDVYYMNRLAENDSSLTSQTSIFEKMNTNLMILDYVIGLNLDQEIEKMIIHRIVDLDYISRLFRKQIFLNSKSKKRYYQIMNQFFKATKSINYDIADLIMNNVNKQIYEYLKSKEYDKVINLIDWDLNEKNKKVVFDPLKQQFYFVMPTRLKTIYVDLKTFVNNAYELNDKIYVEITCFGCFTKVNYLQIRDEKKQEVFINFELIANNANYYVFAKEKSEISFTIKNNSPFTLIYDDFKKVNVEIDNNSYNF